MRWNRERQSYWRLWRISKGNTRDINPSGPHNHFPCRASYIVFDIAAYNNSACMCVYPHIERIMCVYFGNSSSILRNEALSSRTLGIISECTLKGHWVVFRWQIEAPRKFYFSYLYTTIAQMIIKYIRPYIFGVHLSSGTPLNLSLVEQIKFPYIPIYADFILPY